LEILLLFTSPNWGTDPVPAINRAFQKKKMTIFVLNALKWMKLTSRLYRITCCIESVLI
jgi:hypothetical protein